MICSNYFDDHAYNRFSLLKCRILSIVMKAFYVAAILMLLALVIIMQFIKDCCWLIDLRFVLSISRTLNAFLSYLIFAHDVSASSCCTEC